MRHISRATKNFREQLREAGLSVTNSRLTIMEELANSKEPLTPQEIAERVSGTCDQATVYRIVRSLDRAGIIRQIDLRHNHAHYEIVSGKKHHHHLVCRICGNIEDIEICVVSDIEKQILKKSHSFAQIQDHSLEFFGLCKKCHAKLATGSLYKTHETG